MPFYQLVIDRKKTHELRYNDRDFQENDYIYLQEYDQFKEMLTGRASYLIITHVLDLNSDTIRNMGLVLSSPNWVDISFQIMGTQLLRKTTF